MRLLLILSVACTQAEPPLDELAPLRQRISSEARAHEVACDLADRVGPRPAGSEGDRRAVEWALAKMNAIGLANVRSEKVTVTHWERGPEHGEIVSPVKQKLSLAALGQSVS